MFVVRGTYLADISLRHAHAAAHGSLGDRHLAEVGLTVGNMVVARLRLDRTRMHGQVAGWWWEHGDACAVSAGHR